MDDENNIEQIREEVNIRKREREYYSLHTYFVNFQMESIAVEDDKISEASMEKEERVNLENSTPILGPREQEEFDKDTLHGVREKKKEK